MPTTKRLTETQIILRMTNAEKAAIRAACRAENRSMNNWIMNLVFEKLKEKEQAQ